MKIENVAGVRFASGSALEQQRHGAVCNGVLGKVIVDDKHILALVHKVFGDGNAGIGRKILQRSLLRSGGGNYKAVIHGARLGELLHYLCDGGSLLTDGDVNADYILALLIDNGIDGKSGFTGLSVADDKLTLTAANGNKAVYGLVAGLKRSIYGFSFDNAVSFLFYLTVFLCLNGALAVYGLTQRIDNSAYHGFAHRNGNNLSGAADLVALDDVAVVAEEHAAYVVLFKVLHHAVNLSGELDKLARHCIVKPVNSRDTVADLNNRAELGGFKAALIISDLFFDQLVYFIGSEIHRNFSMPLFIVIV